MTAATDAAKKFKGMVVAKHGEWDTKLTKALADNKLDAKGWKKLLTDATKELGQEQKDMRSNMQDYEKVFAAFHEDIKGRLKNTEIMMKAIPGSKDAARLQAQATDYIKTVIRELAEGLDNLKTESKAWVGNRANIALNGLDKAKDPVPVKELQSFLKDYSAERKKLIDYSNSITNAHLNKVKSYEPRAMDLLKAIQKLGDMDTASRDEIKGEVREMVEEVEAFFKAALDGNFISPASALKDLSKLRKDLDKMKPEDQKKKLDGIGGDQRIKIFATKVTKDHNSWKIIEKKVVALRAVSNKLKNKTLDKRVKTLEKLSAKNKALGDGFKGDIARVVEIWKKVGSLAVTS